MIQFFDDIHWFKVLQVFLLSSIKFLLAVPYAFKMKFDCLQTIIITSSGGISGVIFYFYFFSGMLRLLRKHFLWRYNLIFNKIFARPRRFFEYRKKVRQSKFKHRKKFTRKNKIIVRIKQKWGLFGIAFLTPILLTIPLGTFLATKYYSRHLKKTVLISLFISVLAWSIILSLLMTFF